eukprot:CAMPEP_0197191578 /NCGR_PEP_ID=MMETSP1423-20130617/23643_1 /TAXON_ID=476441 /ORGANISM="Pseudo-nitzschia heimii, Strain UNC1101" /LENGTH=41 /DNA_ID= /DNA_START= /DNA_END= /DNA_ORIENTATION=
MTLLLDGSSECDIDTDGVDPTVVGCAAFGGGRGRTPGAASL